MKDEALRIKVAKAELRHHKNARSPLVIADSSIHELQEPHTEEQKSQRL